jgi:hypothetical protein
MGIGAGPSGVTPVSCLLRGRANFTARTYGLGATQVDTLEEGLEPEPEPEREPEPEPEPEPDAVRSLANYIRSVMSITEISFDNLAVAMLEPQQHVPVSIPLLSDMMQ